MITLAGEGIEFPIATDHNIQIDYEPFARKAKVRQYFTPVIGNEVTTKLGHFNVFPVNKNLTIPYSQYYELKSWDEIFKEIKKNKDVRVMILNHARDIHGGTRPFGPKWHNAAVGNNLKGWQLQANAMEVINSGATQTDTLQLLRDWMTQLNRGVTLTPVGCSDSHDVNRYIVGQGRTYIRTDDRNPEAINKKDAFQKFVNGNVMVSYGLLAEMKVNNKYQSGELAIIPKGETEVSVDLRVLGPHWVNASRIQLYANGQLIKEEAISKNSSTKKGVKWSGTWKLKVPQHDVHLVAIATGPGITAPFWSTALPYQPTSPDFVPRILGCSGAIWIDADRDGKKTSAFEYAKQIHTQHGSNLSTLIINLKNYDAAIAAQAASMYHASRHSIVTEKFKATLKKGTPETQDGFRHYINAWRKTIIARSNK